MLIEKLQKTFLPVVKMDEKNGLRALSEPDRTSVKHRHNV